MTVPRWAPQNQQASVAGRDATTVGRDQHIQNIYQAKAQGLTISYADFVDAIKAERLEERRQVEDHFLSELKDAYADFTKVQWERNQLLAERTALRRSLTLRSSWWFVGLLAFLGLSLGAILGSGFASAKQPITTDPPVVTVTATATVAPTATVTELAPDESTDGDVLEPTLSTRPCEPPEYVVQLAAVSPNTSVPEERATVLADDLEYRLKFTDRGESVRVSVGTDYCYLADSKYANYLFIWVGPMSRARAVELCQLYRRTGVSADCIASNPIH